MQNRDTDFCAMIRCCNLGAFHWYQKMLSNLSDQESQGHRSLSRAAAQGSRGTHFPQRRLSREPAVHTGHIHHPRHAMANKRSHAEPTCQSLLGERDGHARAQHLSVDPASHLDTSGASRTDSAAT